MMFGSICIQLSILRYLLLGFRVQNLEGDLMTNPLSVRTVKIHHRCFWEFRACIEEVAKVADII